MKNHFRAAAAVLTRSLHAPLASLMMLGTVAHAATPAVDIDDPALFPVATERAFVNDASITNNDFVHDINEWKFVRQAQDLGYDALHKEIAAARADPAHAAPAVAAWVRLIDTLRSIPDERDLVMLAQGWVNTVIQNNYAEASGADGKPGQPLHDYRGFTYYQGAYETLVLQSGQCGDTANLLDVTLMESGMPRERISLLAGDMREHHAAQPNGPPRGRWLGDGHVVEDVALKDGENLVLNNTHVAPISADMSFDEKIDAFATVAAPLPGSLWVDKTAVTMPNGQAVPSVIQERISNFPDSSGKGGFLILGSRSYFEPRLRVQGDHIEVISVPASPPSKQDLKPFVTLVGETRQRLDQLMRDPEMGRAVLHVLDDAFKLSQNAQPAAPAGPLNATQQFVADLSRR